MDNKNEIGGNTMVKKFNAKNYLASKTFWGAVVVVVAGIMVSLGYIEAAAVVGSLGAGLGLIGVRNAEGKLTWK
jgi:hypothetical protein